MASHVVDITLESATLACDDWKVCEVSGHERISQLFSFELRVVIAGTDAPDPRDVLGALVTLVFTEDGEERRRIHGLIAEATDLSSTEAEHRSLRLLLVPRAHRCTLVRTQESFMRLTLEGIIRLKLSLVGIDNDVGFILQDPGPRREFVVQYDETDLAFISRLTEHMGIGFYFDHSSDADRIVFVDRNEGYRAAKDALPFQARGERRDVFRLVAKAQLVPGVAVVSDYNYMTPQVPLAASSKLASGYAGGVIEYHTNYETPMQGAVLARVRAEEIQCTSFVLEGEADICTLSAGTKYTVTGHPVLGDIDILVTEVVHRATQVVLASGGNAGQSPYNAVFKAISASTAYRPPRITPRPRIHGLVSGIVEAPPGVETESAWIDKHGRYLVRMLFDTAQPSERKASLPIRMMQPHSGPGYGIHFPLRPGTEVMVGFVGGDPDRPIIVGSIPNALTPTPVVDKSAHMHRVQTWSGVLIEIDDGK